MVSQRSFDVGPLTLEATEAGVGGRPLLLVHGFTGNRNDFDTVIEPLAERGWHVVAPDQRGHGTSGRVDDEAGYSFEIFAADLVAVVDQLGWDTFVVLGHSMGGMIVQTLVLAEPQRVRGLILMDTTSGQVALDPEVVGFGQKIAREEGMETLVAIMRDLEDPLATPAHLRMCDTVPGYQERSEGNTLASSAAMFASMAGQITAPHDRLAALASVRCPTLVMCGRQDLPNPLWMHEEMAALIPGAVLRVIEDCGHLSPIEQPQAVSAALREWLSW